MDPVRNPRVVGTPIEGGRVLLLHLDSGAYRELNPVGAQIWDKLDGHTSESQVAAELQAEILGAPGDLSDTVAEFISQLRNDDLVV